MKIVLAGFMGTGKTSVGRALGGKLGYSFVDTDILIEKREGMTISRIFRENGEGYFREVERSVVEEVSNMKDVVIATGGGVIKDSGNVANLRRRGIIFCLQADPEIILKRVMAEDGTRPLLDVEEPLNEIKKLLAERLPFYEQADISVDTNYITAEETADKIIEMLGMDGQNVNVDLGERSYDILIGRKMLQRLGTRVKELRPSKVAIVSNKTVFPLYKDVVIGSLKEAGIEPEIVLIPDGEEYKDLLWTYNILGELLKAKFDRKSILIALGGGVIGDITGFAASAYMRGIRFIQVPTTLLSQVDSSVGGKTGVNHPLGKNMIGAFYQPSLVMIDVDTLKTLPKKEFAAGMGEVIKYGVIDDAEFFNYIKDNHDSITGHEDSIIHVVKRSCEIKADVVSKDELEAGLRAILNYGHTVGHAIETVTGYKKYLHGEAVAIGMCAAAEIAVKMGLLDKESVKRVRELVAMYDLPADIPSELDTQALIDAMEIDKKTEAGRLKFILPDSIGSVRIEDDVNRELIKEVLTNN